MMKRSCGAILLWVALAASAARSAEWKIADAQSVRVEQAKSLGNGDWQIAPSGLIVRVKSEAVDGATRFNISMIADRATQHDGPIEIRLPDVTTSWRESLRTYSAFCGGAIEDWPNDKLYPRNSSQWPGYGYSPLAQLYDSADGSGVQIVAWNDALENTSVQWALNPGGLVAIVIRFAPHVDAAQTLSATLEMKPFSGGLPDAGLTHYRETFLLPWAQRSNIVEAEYKTDGPWSMNNWPAVGGGQYRAGDLARIVGANTRFGAKGHIQWSTAEAKPGRSVYEPDHRAYPWFAEFPVASRAIGGQFGCLIAPQFLSTRGDLADMASPQRRAWVAKYRDDLKATGVNIVYWDSAQGPTRPSMQPMDWLGILQDWRKAGIVVAPESSCDVAVLVSGATVFYPARLADQRMPRLITPKGTVFMMDHTKSDWIAGAVERGFVPILTGPQLLEYARRQPAPK